MAAELIWSEKRNTFDRLIRHKHEICSGLDQLEDSPMVFLKIKTCNADAPCSFSDAWCETERSEMFARLVTLFDISLLTRFLDTGKIEGDFRKQESLHWALKALADFLDNDCDEANRIMKYGNSKLKEYEWVTLFGAHFVKKLSGSKVMTISDACYETRLNECRCGCGEELQYGDTSMGNKQVWHGSVDILLGNVAVHNVKESKDSSDNPSAYELTRESLQKHEHQICSQAIVFSCTERSEQQCSSAPLVAVSFEHFKIYMYDYNKDLFIETQEFSLRPPVRMLSVLTLWLTINHTLFSKELPKYSEFGLFAGFKNFICLNKEVYEKKMHFRQCKKVYSSKPELLFYFMEQKQIGGTIWVEDKFTEEQKGADEIDCVEKDEEPVAEKKRRIDPSERVEGE